MRATIALILLVLVSVPAIAAYNANMEGKLTLVAVYADGDYIYLRLDNQPTSHPQCNPSYFVIHETVPLDRRQMMLSRLMMAYAAGETVNLGYDGTGDCAHGYMRVHRAG